MIKMDFSNSSARNMPCRHDFKQASKQRKVNKMNSIKISSLFDLPLPQLSAYEYAWEVIADIGSIIASIGKALSDDYLTPSENIWIHRSARIAESAEIAAPCIIEKGAEVRHCAYIRGSAFIGEGAVIGNSSEIKNSIIMSYACLPHFNYSGDSIVGRGAHLGAGAVISNLKLDKTNVTVACGGERLETGIRKFGAAIGDGAEIGCGSVICPGSIIGKNSIIYPLSFVRGCVGENMIYKSAGCISERRD